MKLEDVEIRPEVVIFELIQSSGRAEQKIDTILTTLETMNQRINKRETEIEDLERDHTQLDKRVVSLEASQANNWKWLLLMGTFAAGFGAVIAKFL